MTKEDKELLLKDLCSRLTYGVKCEVIKRCIDGEMVYIKNGTDALELTVNNVKELITNNLYEIKPYLFHLSNMTDEQRYECFNGTPLEIDKYGDVAVKDDFFGNSLYTDLEIYLEVIDWLLKNHFDIYGLIEKDLAIDATGKSIY